MNRQRSQHPTPGFLAAVAIAVAAGCVDPNVELFPPAPDRVEHLPDHGEIRWYDSDVDGVAEYGEQTEPGAARVVRLHFTGDAEGESEEVYDRTAPSADADVRDLFIILDSIPFPLVEELYASGRLRLFHPPSRIISTFPVMTDPALAELFGASPCPTLEAAAYDGRRLIDGYAVHVRSGNVPWAPFVDYRLQPISHMFIYTSPNPWYLHELKDIQDRIIESDRRRLVAYVVSTSSLGVYQGRDGHLAALVALDRLCQWVTHHFRGRVRITLMSDHGHNLVRSERIPLETLLNRFGYRVRATLERPGDVVLPAFGMVTVAALHTREPDAVAADFASVEGVAQTLYREQDGSIIVLDRAGRAAIRHHAGRFSYVIERGDPLSLSGVMEQMRAAGELDEAGFATDAAWFAATADHAYPDALRRIWRAYNGLLIHTPDVYICAKDGYHCGSEFMSEYVDDVRATHGSLYHTNSLGFVMTTAGALPPVMRMDRVADALRNVKVILPGRAPLLADDQ